MPLCSYCDHDRAPTREHIIPSWYYRHDSSPDDLGFMEKAKGKIIKTELVIRDVCGVCNNGSLSELDAYGKELFFSHLNRYVFKDSNESLSYDYEKLVRWLLKISYNSARAHDSDAIILAQYKKAILGEQALPAGLILRIRTIAPATHGVYSVFPAEKDSAIANYPTWFRVGVFRVNSFDSMYWAFRHITINSYSFLLYIPDLSSSHASAEADSLMDAVAAENDGSIVLDSTGEVIVPEPRIDSISFNMNHIGQFPITYGVVENNAIEAALDNRFGLVNYWIDRKDIEEKDISNALAFLNNLISSREVCTGLMERVEISVHGYDDDSREIYEIPEVIEFLVALDSAWPYWMLFQHPKFSWLQVMAVCLCRPARTEDGRVIFDHKLMQELIEKWFCSLNELCHTFAISLTVNKRASATAQTILTRGLA